MTKHIAKKSLGGAMMAALLLTTSVERTEAGDLGKVIGAVGLGVIVGCQTGALKCRGTRNVRPGRNYAPKMSQAQRQQNRDVQSSLNAFGFPAGTVDGSLGKRSRAAIRDYQGYMGYARTGQLTAVERDMLVNGWRKLQAGGGNAYPQTMAALGARGLLNIERDPNFPSQFGDNVGGGYAGGGYNGGGYNGGGYNNGGQNGGNWGTAQPGNRMQPQPFPQPVQPIQEAKPLPVPTPIPDLNRTGEVIASAASRCELVAQTTRIQNGVIQAVNMTDSNQALSEKFCEARSFAITQGNTVSAQFQISSAELEGHCTQITEGFKTVVSALPSAQIEQSAAATKVAVSDLGLTDPSTATAYGKICMGVGYKLDNAEMALSGALMLMAGGHAPHAEVVGHHLREGFGVPASTASAVPYYSVAMNALEQGAEPAFMPSTTVERVQVIRAALKLDAQRASNQSGGLQQFKQVSAKLPALTLIKN